MYGIKSTISDIRQAISLLGKDVVRTFAIVSVVNSTFEIDLSPYKQ
jgi:HD-like signal output (HDOD) protein